jgi:peptide chain release factor 1
MMVFRCDDELLFANEAGGHRFQRIPPNEKRGRVHTSTVTVAVIPETNTEAFQINPKDIQEKTTRGSGPGGQNRNKVETCVVLTHVPTNTIVRIDTGRSQHHNRERAMQVMKATLSQRQREKVSQQANQMRSSQIGSGMRGDKRRTIRYQDGVVTDHVLGTRMRLQDYLAGKMF